MAFPKGASTDTMRTLGLVFFCGPSGAYSCAWIMGVCIAIGMYMVHSLPTSRVAVSDLSLNYRFGNL